MAGLFACARARFVAPGVEALAEVCLCFAGGDANVEALVGGHGAGVPSQAPPAPYR
jgi:hypothetical protein